MAASSPVDLGVLVTGQPSGAETITISGPGLTDRVGNPVSDSVTLNLKDKTAPTVTQVSSTAAVESAFKVK